MGRLMGCTCPPIAETVPNARSSNCPWHGLAGFIAAPGPPPRRKTSLTSAEVARQIIERQARGAWADAIEDYESRHGPIVLRSEAEYTSRFGAPDAKTQIAWGTNYIVGRYGAMLAVTREPSRRMRARNWIALKLNGLALRIAPWQRPLAAKFGVALADAKPGEPVTVKLGQR
jgi:hypothetical protein